jgi:hypothetical protein
VHVAQLGFSLSSRCACVIEVPGPLDEMCHASLLESHLTGLSLCGHVAELMFAEAVEAASPPPRSPGPRSSSPSRTQSPYTASGGGSIDWGQDPEGDTKMHTQTALYGIHTQVPPSCGRCSLDKSAGPMVHRRRQD